MPRPQNESFSLAAVLDSARRDGQTQREGQEYLRHAADFLFDLVEHANAFNEKMPRGYIVVPVKGRKKGKKGVVPRVELRLVGRGIFGPAPHKVALRDADGTQLLQTRDFAKHLKAGCLDELGDFFVARYRKSQQETRKLAQSVAAIETIRRHLERVEKEE